MAQVLLLLAGAAMLCFGAYRGEAADKLPQNDNTHSGGTKS